MLYEECLAVALQEDVDYTMRLYGHRFSEYIK